MSEWIEKEVKMLVKVGEKVKKGNGRWLLIKLNGKKFVMREVDEFWEEKGEDSLEDVLG